MENPIARLSQVIAQSATDLTNQCEAQGVKIPSLDDIQATGQTPQLNEKMALDAANIMAAAQELLAILNPAELYVFNVAQGVSFFSSTLLCWLLQSMRTAAVRAAIHFHVAEILREGDQKVWSPLVLVDYLYNIT